MDPKHLPPDFRDFLECLNAAGVEYLLVGGHAVAFHGYVRVTSDMDIWIHRTGENAERIIVAVRKFFDDEMRGLTAEQLLDEATVTHFGARPQLIEILGEISGGNFSEAWRKKITADYDGILTNIISLLDLKKNKKSAGRAKDLADLENLP